MMSENIGGIEDEREKIRREMDEIRRRWCLDCPRLGISGGCRGCGIREKKERLWERERELREKLREMEEKSLKEGRRNKKG